MRVVVVTSFPADPGRPSGGVQSVSVTLMEYLTRARDIEWHVVTQDRDVTQPRVAAWNGAQIHRLPRPHTSMLRNAIGPGRKQIRAYVAALRPDVVHTHDTFGMMVKGLNTGAPRVFTVHGFIHKDIVVSGRKMPWLRSRIWKPLEIAGWADQDHIISINPYVREFLTGRTKAVVHDIDNPIREAFFDIDRQEIRGRIFSAAEVSPRKNTFVLVQAVEKLLARGVDVELRLAGRPAHPGYVETIDKFIVERGIGKKVARLGLVPYDQIREELATASIFALASLEENSPMGIEEAMAAGVPVVTSNRCGMPYMVRDGESGFLVEPTDPQDVADRIEEILSNPALAERMSVTSRAIARERFHPVRVAERTLAVYRRAARDRGR